MLCCFLAILTIQEEELKMTYTLGSFNIKQFNLQFNSHRSLDFRKLAEIISSEKFDVVALQEVYSELAVKHLVNTLNNFGYEKWDYCLPPNYIGHPEYAFIWQKTRLCLLDKENNPTLLNSYHSDKPGQTKLSYPPLAARFTPQGLIGGSNFEIRLINTHLSPRTSKGFSHTQDEFRTLAQQIYRLYSSKRDGSNLPAYTIILGDYNLCILDWPYVDESIFVTDGRILKTVQTEKTSLKQNSPDTPISDNDYYANNYDHFSYEISLLDKLKLQDSRVPALRKYYENDLAAYRKEISDHVPIKLILDLKHG